MHDTIHALQSDVREGAVTDVADQELHGGGQLRRGVAVHLRLEAVQHDDLVAARYERVHEVPADETGAAGDEGLHVDPILVRVTFRLVNG
jgi:hypothetical protein